MKFPGSSRFSQFTVALLFLGFAMLPSARAATTLFFAGIEQFGTGSGQIDLYTISLGGNTAGSDTFTVGNPGTLATTNSTNEGKPDVNNPADLLFDKNGDLLIANGGTSNADPGSFACVPAGAVTTGANSSTTITQAGTNPQRFGALAYDPRDGSAAIGNVQTSTTQVLFEYLLNGSYVAAGASRTLTAPYPYGAFSVTPVPSLQAGTYAVAMNQGKEADTAHGGAAGANKVALFAPTGVETDITDDTGFSVDLPYGVAFDGQNNQLVIANNSTWHRLVSFYNMAISPPSLVKTINTTYRNSYVATSPDGHVAVVYGKQFGYPQVQIYDNTAARNPVFGPIPFNGTTTSCGSTYIYGSSSAIVTSVRWLSNTKLLIALEGNDPAGPTAKNGFYIYDITNSQVPAGFDDISCSAFVAAPINTGFTHVNTHPFGASVRAGTFAFADPAGSCGGNAPCYTSINTAISNVSTGGVVNIFGGTYNEVVALTNSNVTLNLDGNTTVNGFILTAGTLNAGAGSCGQAGAYTLTLASGNWTNNGGTFNSGSGMVAFTGSSAQTIGGSVGTTFNNLTINNAAGVTLSAAATVKSTLTLTNGAFGNGANLTLANGVSIVRNNSGAPGGSLGSAPTFGTIVNVTYTGNLAIAGSPEIPASSTVLNNLTINNAGGVTLGGNASVNGAFTLTSGNVTTGANVLAISASATRSRTSGYIIGNEKKTYNANGSFTYDVGTANGYSPVDVTTTAGTGDLTVVAVQGSEPSVVSNRSLQRYWTLTKGGAGVTANLVFHYLDPTDIMGTESNYQVLQVTGGARTYYTNNCPAPCVNGAANTFALNGVTNFSDFTAAEARADLQMNNSAAANAVVGNNLSYMIILTNGGPDTSTSPTVTDAVPAQTTLVSVTTPAGWTRTDSVPAGGTGTIGFSKSSMASAETATFTIVVKVNANAVGGSTITDTATAASAITIDPDLSNNSGTAMTLVYTPPAITSGNNTTFVVGTAGSFTVTTTGFPTPTVTESGTLPNGVTFDTSTKKLSGTAGAGTGGSYLITFSASNAAGGTPAQSFTLTVNQAPAITSANMTTFTAGTAGNFNVIAAGYPSPTISLTSGSLPTGVNYGNGTLAGTPASNAFGTYPLTFTASNGIGSNAVQNFSLVVNPNAQDVKSKPSITENVGGGFHVAFIGNPGTQYTIQFAPTLPVLPAVPNWQTLSLQTANASGIFSVDDTPGTTVRFYRAIIP